MNFNWILTTCDLFSRMIMFSLQQLQFIGKKNNKSRKIHTLTSFNLTIKQQHHKFAACFLIPFASRQFKRALSASLVDFHFFFIFPRSSSGKTFSRNPRDSQEFYSFCNKCLYLRTLGLCQTSPQRVTSFLMHINDSLIRFSSHFYYHRIARRKICSRFSSIACFSISRKWNSPAAKGGHFFVDFALFFICIRRKINK